MSLLSLSKRVQSDPLKVRCVGCYQEFPKAFAHYGKLWTVTRWITKEKKELEFDPQSGKTTTVVTETRIPISGYAKGAICEDCLTSKCRTYVNRKGETVKSPLCILDVSPRARTTVVPMKETHRATVTPSYQPIVTRSLKAKVRGGGGLEWDPLTGQVFQEVQEEVHGGCYNKFGRS